MQNLFPIDSPGNWLFLLVAVFAVFAAYLVLIFWMNRNFPHGNHIQTIGQPKNLPQHLPATITTTIWNIGYGGLGKESDFVTDGGKSWFPPSSEIVKKNLNGINASLAARPLHASNVLMLQEVSVNSPLSLWVPIRKSITQALRQFFITYRPDISTWGVPWPLKISHGTLSIAKCCPSSTSIIPLPSEPTYLAGLLKRNYALLVNRFNIQNSTAQWVLINLHLAAFDPKGATRFKQLEAVMTFAQSEFNQGNFVILGGDWNMALTSTNFPHSTDISKLFWLVDLPKDQIPPHWSIATDTKTPTVRTNYQPYLKHQNYTAIIDGFIVSPNVQIDKVTTTNTQFEHTDHQPVTATFSTKPTS